MIVDTSALIAILRDEPGGAELQERMLAGEEVRISAGTLIEARMVAERYGGRRDVDALLTLVGAEVVPVDLRQAELAAEGFRRFGKGRHKAGLNLGDLFAYALARSLQEPLLFVANDFARTDVTVA